MLKKHILLFLSFLTLATSVWAQKVYVLTLRDEVNASSAWYITRGYAAAEAAKADLVVLHIDTYGGTLVHADSIRTRILRSPLRTIAFVDRNAASAGALIALACDSIYMASGAALGAATVVNGDDGRAAPDKYQSYMRAVMRSTAQNNGRDPRIAEKMVDQNLDLPGISPAGQVITFSTEEAILNGYCEGERATISDVLAGMQMSKATVTTYHLTTQESIIQALVSTTVSTILLILIFGGLFFELKAPGKSIPGLIAIFATVAYFVPHYIYGLAAYWEMLLFVVGLILLAFEIFVTPGFGLPGILGLVFAMGGLVGGLLGNDGLEFGLIPVNEILKSIALAFVSLATSLLLVVWAAQFLITKRRAYPFVDDSTMDKEKGYTAFRSEMNDLVGQEGIADTDLKPAGFIEVNGKRYDAESDGPYISKGAAIRVKLVRSTKFIVQRV